MSGYDQEIYQVICKSHGHHISCLAVEREIDPRNGGSVVDRLEVFCTACGMSLEEIRQQKIKKARVPRQPKAPVEVSNV